jgi:putative tryptophan/tyrosine transport system substrate-binding protein
MPVIGYLSARSREDTSHLIAAFQRGLAESDYVDGRNVTIEYRFALGQYDKLPAMANELVRLPVTVIATDRRRAVGAGGEGCDLEHPDRVRHW